jgi:hypothetical protein
MSGPDSGEFQRTDEPSQLALGHQSCRELTSQIDAIAEEGCRDSGLRLDSGLRISQRDSLGVRGVCSERRHFVSLRSLNDRMVTTPFHVKHPLKRTQGRVITV